MNAFFVLRSVARIGTLLEDHNGFDQLRVA